MFPGRRRLPSRTIALAVLCLLAVGCASDALPTDAATGLPILDDLPPFPGSAASLEWRESSEPADGLSAGDTTHATIGELVAAIRVLAAEADAEVNIGFLGPPEATRATLVVQTSSSDEASAGQELVADVRRNDRGWYVEAVRFRTHCRRGIDPETDDCV